ncbi:hypothetical protein [Membranihabitans marinus]|uniref:hypothetical protein n=1 Tax=Membranihabitans marinus TaxID=1227546 RepID=UPI001F223D9D|nr:hypothetical protein [Membranihabitans marinus]
MISVIRNSVLTQFLWGFMGLFLLNISVDTADPNPEHIPEDLSINDQESIVEFVVEKLLGFEDAFQEYDDHDIEDHNKNTNAKVYFTDNIIEGLVINLNTILTDRQIFSDYNISLTEGFCKINTPPPKF